MKGNARATLHNIADNVHCMYLTIMREKIKYAKFSTNVTISIDNAFQWVGQSDEFIMNIKFGNHMFEYSEDQIVYSYWKKDKPEIYDIIEIPNINTFELTEESFFQQYTKYDFKDFELEDLLALEKIRQRIQTIWSDHLLR